MTSESVPRSALVLGYAGILPFVWGVLTLYVEPLQHATMSTVGARFLGPYVLLSYGTVILCFMSGVLWGFATRAEGEVAAMAYALSTLPALWAFFFVGGGPVSASIYLIAGFVAVLGIDALLWWHGLTPTWWLRLRIPLTVIVCGCLGFVALG